MMRKTATKTHLGFLATAAMTAAAFASIALAQGAAPTGTDPRLQGAWVVNASEKEMEPNPEIIGAVVTFTGDKFTVERTGGRSKWGGTVKADAKTGKIDLHHEADIFLPPLKGETWEGLYRINGSTLEINTTMAHEKRAADFEGGYDVMNIKAQKR